MTLEKQVFWSEARMTQALVELALPDGPLYASEETDAFVTKLGGRPVLQRTYTIVVIYGL